MVFNYFTVPGKILKEYMDSRNISQKDLANITESSQRHISQVVNGKARISEEFALKLEKVFEDVKAEYWLNLEMNYQLYLLRNKVNDNVEITNAIKDYKLDYVFAGLDYTKEEMFNEFLTIVGESSIKSLENTIYNNHPYLFSHDDGDAKPIYLWLKLCEEQIDLQNNMDDVKDFDYNKFKNNYKLLKKLLNTKDYSLAIKNVRKFLNMFGIVLVIEEALPNSKIKGATTLYKGKPAIYLSNRYRRLDSIYFTLIHEIYHIINKDYENLGYSVSYEEDEREKKSNMDTREFFINEENYNNMLSKKNITAEDLMVFANKNGLIVDIIIGFLQRDGVLEYSQYNHLRTYVDKQED